MGSSPVQSLCVHAYDCCFAFQERVRALDEDCGELVGASPDDDEICQEQLDRWLAQSIAQGFPLAECVTR